MTNFRNFTAMGAAVAIVAVGSFAFAQEDELEDLLSEVESPTTAAETVSVGAAADEDTGGSAAESAEEPAAAEAAGNADAVAVGAPSVAEVEPSVAEVGPAAAEVSPDVAEVSSSAAPAPAVEATEPVAQAAPAAEGDAELLENVRLTEEIRRRAMDLQTKREIEAARASMKERDYAEAARHYRIANKLLPDSNRAKKLRRECEQGEAEALYRDALQEYQLGNRAKAMETVEQARNLRHPKAARQLTEWKAAAEEGSQAEALASISHRRNEPQYKAQREQNRKHLRRSRQLLAVRDIDGALEECELVLKSDKYNQEAIRLRKAIIRKSGLILEQEREGAHDSMIAEVGKKWRPVYAPNARKLDEIAQTTVKRKLGEDPERTQEQAIIQRMKEMLLPTISFKPPATIIDAVEFFRGASKDFDRPDVPIEQRGFNFVLKTPGTLTASPDAAPAEESNDFTSSGEAAAEPTQPGIPVIKMITASNITFYDALKLVCDSVDYKFKVQGQIVMVMPKDMSIDEMVTRSYPVVAAFLDRMGSASSDVKEMKSAGFGGGSSKSDEGNGENQERDWKDFFSLMGVQWPEGSSILYIKTIGKLRVKNTYDNLAELEKALTELNVDQKLIEIEARFVEVAQEDLNSLGFEWILNSDYAFNVGGGLQNVLDLKDGVFGRMTGSTTAETVTQSGSTITGGTKTSTLSTTTSSLTTSSSGTQGASWIQADGSGKNVGINAMGGTSQFGPNNRYLSTEGNHISGTGKSTNDQFMKVNAFLGSADLSMILHMLSQRSDTDLLSAPKVLTRPGEQAVIKVVTEFIYPTDYNVQLQSSSSSGGSYGSSQSAVLAIVEPQSFTMREVGVILDVTPTLTDDGNLIDLKLDTKVVQLQEWYNYGMRIPFSGNSSLTDFTGIGEIFSSLSELIASLGATLSSDVKEQIVNNATDSALSAMASLSSKNTISYYEAKMEQPFFHTRSIESNVSIYPGATIVMGGLITEERKAMDDKVPFLGDLPFVGRLFRSHSEWTKKRNLLIFVTTRLVDVRGREVTVGSTELASTEEVKAAPEAAEE